MNGSTGHVHLPIVAGSWSDPVDLGDGTQRITNSGPCQTCRERVQRVEVRSAPLAPQEWSVGEDLLSAGPWGTAQEHQQWRQAVDQLHARYEADLAAWRETCSRLDATATNAVEVDQ